MNRRTLLKSLAALVAAPVAAIKAAVSKPTVTMGVDVATKPDGSTLMLWQRDFYDRLDNTDQIVQMIHERRRAAFRDMYQRACEIEDSMWKKPDQTFRYFMGQ